jgi:RimJ/RimL family protein N-acetyltransferase
MRLESERLIFKIPSERDVDDIKNMWSDPIVNFHFGGKTMSREEAWNKVLRMNGLWPLFGYGYFSVFDRAGRFAGSVGLARYRRGVDDRLEALPEIGWALASWAHGKGYALEASRRVLHWADTELKDSHTWCLINEANVKSILLAEKIGYTFLRNSEFEKNPVKLFERPRNK